MVDPEFATGRDFVLRLKDGISGNDFLRQLVNLDLPLVSFSQQRRHLNDAFMELTTRGVR